jgi:hypothetical protein
MKQRETLARVDDDIKRGKVDVARKIIYQKKYAVDSKYVKTLLKEQSLAPTAVSAGLAMCYPRVDPLPVERIFAEAFLAWFQPIPYACCRPHARIRVRRVEGFIYPSLADVKCYRQSFDT